MSTKQIERLEKIRAKGRKHYIFYTGILGWGNVSVSADDILELVRQIWVAFDCRLSTSAHVGILKKKYIPAK